MPKRAKKEPQLLKTLSDVARHFELNINTLKSWRQRADPFPGETGSYNVEEIEAWMKRSFPRGAGRTGPVSEHDDGQDEDGKPKSLTFRKLKAQTEKEEALARIQGHRAIVETGEVVEVQSVNQFMAEFFASLRRGLLAIPVEMAAGYPAKIRSQIEEDLRERLELYLTQQADWLEQTQALKEEVDD